MYTIPKPLYTIKYVGVCKVGEKGQIVIPKPARDMFNINSGDNVIVLCDKKKGMAIIKADFFDTIAEKIFKRSDK